MIDSCGARKRLLFRLCDMTHTGFTFFFVKLSAARGARGRTRFFLPYGVQMQTFEWFGEMFVFVRSCDVLCFLLVSSFFCLFVFLSSRWK